MFEDLLWEIGGNSYHWASFITSLPHHLIWRYVLRQYTELCRCATWLDSILRVLQSIQNCATPSCTRKSGGKQLDSISAIDFTTTTLPLHHYVHHLPLFTGFAINFNRPCDLKLHPPLLFIFTPFWSLSLLIQFIFTRNFHWFAFNMPLLLRMKNVDIAKHINQKVICP